MAEIIREIGTYEGEPILLIRRKVYQTERVYGIRLRDAWRFSADHNPNFDRFMMSVCAQVHEYLDLGLVTVQKMAALATVIEDGLDELIGRPPEDEKEESGKAVGEAIVTINGQKLEFEVDERGNFNA
ncbi:MAG: hypothetical protein HQK55_07995 [Deltaproteobacteria bacterium]|nr:hypothetical protein [Deltaproteobacteria bacterium]